MATATPGRIFLSYRREETAAYAGRLYDLLAARFGAEQVFMDVGTLELGVDFAESIQEAVSTCEVLVAVIGSNWLKATDEAGQRRLDNPDDLVRLEVEAALSRDVRVIPVLAERTPMPHRDELPPSLAGLARRHALPVGHDSFRTDAARLVEAVERVLANAAREAAARERQVERAGPPATGAPGDHVLPFHPVLAHVLKHDLEPISIAFSLTGHVLAVAGAGADTGIEVWDAAFSRSRCHRRMRIDISSAYAVAFSSDGRRLAIGGSRFLGIWDATTGERQLQIPIDDGQEVVDVAFTSDDRCLAVGGRANEIWDLSTVSRRLRLDRGDDEDGEFSRMAFSADDRWLAAGGPIGGVWDAVTGERRMTLPHKDYIWSVAISPDGGSVATGAEATIRVWDLGTGDQQPQTLHLDVVPDEAVPSLAFSLDGRWLAAAINRVAVIWDTATLALQTHLPHDDQVLRVAFSPDSRWLAVCGGRRTRIFELSAARR